MILFKIGFGIGPGESGIMPMLLAMVLLSWPGTARLVRGQILQIREEGYISAARVLGAKTNYLVMRHMIPNTVGVILVTLTFAGLFGAAVPLALKAIGQDPALGAGVIVTTFTDAFGFLTFLGSATLLLDRLH